jgi:hypothetical protein
MAAANANAAAAAAAARALKTSQEHELKTALDVLKETLQEEGWDAYERTFLRLQEHNDWNAGLLDTRVNANGQLTAPWNRAGETAEEQQDRKTFS